MNTIKTNSILDPTIQQPFTGRSLAFLQNANKDAMLGLAQGIIGPNYNISNPYILNGVMPYGTNQYTKGYFLWNGEVFYCSGKPTTTAFAHIPVLVIVDTPDGTADPLTFTDSVGRNVHSIRTLEIKDQLTGTGEFDYSSAINIHPVQLNDITTYLIQYSII